MLQHVDRLLVEYYDNELSLRRRRQVKAHLQECPTCQAELEQLKRLSDVLAEYTLPDTLTDAETFRAQIALRLSRRAARQARYVSWVWYVVPVSLICVLLGLQALLLLPDVLRWAASLAEWSGLLEAFELSTTFSYTVDPSLFSLFKAAWQMFLYLVLFLVLVPYAGWVGVLWRSQARPGTLKGDCNGSS